MINYKIKYNLIGEQNWPEIPSILLEGIKKEPNITLETPKDSQEPIIQSWKNIAVIKVSAENQTKFYIGFSNMGTIRYLKHPFETNLDFGMRVGNDAVRIIVVPLDLETILKIELVEITEETDPKYSDLPVL